MYIFVPEREPIPGLLWHGIFGGRPNLLFFAMISPLFRPKLHFCRKGVPKAEALRAGALHHHACCTASTCIITS